MRALFMDDSFKIELIDCLGSVFREIVEGAHPKGAGLNAFHEAVWEAERQNAWFGQEQVYRACKEWAKILTKAQAEEWLGGYEFENEPKTVALIMAGNIPLVGLHDLISVLVCGHRAAVKLSSKDMCLLPALTAFLVEKLPSLADKIIYSQSLPGKYDAAIATGSNNSGLYFEYYFKPIPKIIRKNRSSVAILTGNESIESLSALGDDIFSYYGLGCRNVSKLFVPRDYDFSEFFKQMQPFRGVMENRKYANNYDWQKAICLTKKEPFSDNGFLILKPERDHVVPAPGILFYEPYDAYQEVLEKIEGLKDRLQCVAEETPQNSHIAFGKSQSPRLWDYADDVDTVAFLTQI